MATIRPADPIDDGVSLGSAIVSLIDPHRGHEREFNRWYERDHMYSCGIAGPHVFAISRWVATRHLKALRRPATSPIAEPVDAGSYLGLFWIESDRHEEQAAWVAEALPRLEEAGRMFPHSAVRARGLADRRGRRSDRRVAARPSLAVHAEAKASGVAGRPARSARSG